ncbi:recombinase family protein [Herbaspirillum sp. SJZ107]|uniref:recombinase family protein n=1 Tax=Herbaspirillum sp. SJZ107 TaxID=2572881 RepID=UPI001154B0C0|nr:recombinase family protein [Herbaspirillum sp. SJZ107]TQK07005.1 DNA invertase Pin-like site-specific DNA recombinase [Herbaspirillum sp. SJZ107]
MATFAYGRVSTKEQTTENQRIEIEASGYTVEYWYADEGVSGKMSAMQRPQFAKMLGQMRDGEKLVVTKLDRLGRDAQDIGATIKMLAGRKIEVVVLQLGKLDLTSPAGKLMLKMLAAVAEMERDLLVERTHAGLERAKAEGKTLGRKSKTTPEQQEKMKNEYANNASVSSLARDYGVSRATVLSIVK